MSERIEALQNKLRAEQVDAFFVTSEVNREYLAGFRATDGWMLITQEEAYLLMDSRYIEAAQNQAKGCKVVLFTQMLETLRELVEKHHVQSMIAEQSRITVAEWNSLKKALPSVELIDSPLLDQELNALRAVKTEKEFADLREAQRLTEEAFERMLTFLRPGITEREAALEIEFYMRRNGAEGVAFDLIVITGAKTSMPHGVPGENVIQAGDFVTMDTGAVINGMHSDMTRTVAIGHASDEMKHVYDTVLRAQLNAIAAVHDGVRCRDVDTAARSVIEQAGYGEYFGHSTGHSVGLEIHETPAFSPRSEDVARENMVITVEPGIYLPGKFGVRIEDMVRVTQKGCQDLTNAKKELIIL